MRTLLCSLVLISLVSLPVMGISQTFYFGADLSYVNQMEDCGAVFKENGQPKDVYEIFADHGTNLVRARLWINPAWQNGLQQPAGVLPQYSDLPDVIETFTRARAAGMQVLLDFHYSDVWADPSRQLIPSRWIPVAAQTAALGDSVYQYTYNTLMQLHSLGLMPEMVQMGNETNSGMLLHTTMNANYQAGGVVSYSWARQGQLFNRAIQAVRAAGTASGTQPKIAIHFADFDAIKSRFQTLMNNGVTDFDIMGFSYYYSWHGESIAKMGEVVADLRASFPAYEVVALETGYLWTTQNHDQNNNIISTPDPQYLPVSLQKQLEYLVDYAWEMKRNGGSGVIFWEPAWVSTPCRTPWAVGSSHDHVAFFAHGTNDFLAEGGGRWAEPWFYPDSQAVKVKFKVNMTGQNVSGGVFIDGDFLPVPGQPVKMVNEGNGIYSHFAYLKPGDTGTYFFLKGTNPDREVVPGACATGADRSFTVPSNDTTIGAWWGTCARWDQATSLDKPASGQYRVFPNPAQQQFRVEWSQAESVSFTLFDLQGRKIHQETAQSGTLQHSVQLPQLPRQNYMLVISENDQPAYHLILELN